jgi:hypothetical protein
MENTVHFARPFLNSALILTSIILLSACSTTSTKVTKILHDPDYKKARYSNVLVIIVTDNYDHRAQFERTVVSAIRRTGAQATAYYTVVGHNPPVSSSDIMNAVRARNFDAVVFTRVKGHSEVIVAKGATPEAQSSVIGGNLFDLFRYDYEEYQEPENIRMSTNVVMVTQLYDPADQKNVWAIEIDSSDRESTANIIESAAAAIVKHLKRDELVGPK